MLSDPYSNNPVVQELLNKCLSIHSIRAWYKPQDHLYNLWDQIDVMLDEDTISLEDYDRITSWLHDQIHERRQRILRSLGFKFPR